MPDSRSGERTGASASKPPKIPESVLVIIHTADLHVLLLERADHPGFWQSVTGSRDSLEEPLTQTCRREVREETGLDTQDFLLTDTGVTNRFEIFAHWRRRYADGVTHNQERVFTLELPAPVDVTLAPREHLRLAARRRDGVIGLGLLFGREPPGDQQAPIWEPSRKTAAEQADDLMRLRAIAAADPLLASAP